MHKFDASGLQQLRAKLSHKARLDAVPIEAVLDREISDRDALLEYDPAAEARMKAMCKRLQRARRAHPFSLPSK